MSSGVTLSAPPSAVLSRTWMTRSRDGESASARVGDQPVDGQRRDGQGVRSTDAPPRSSVGSGVGDVWEERVGQRAAGAAGEQRAEGNRAHARAPNSPRSSTAASCEKIPMPPRSATRIPRIDRFGSCDAQVLAATARAVTTALAPLRLTVCMLTVEVFVQRDLDPAASHALDVQLLDLASQHPRRAWLRVYDLAGDVVSLGPLPRRSDRRSHRARAPAPPPRRRPRAAARTRLRRRCRSPCRTVRHWWREDPLALRPEQVLNRCVRALLGGLRGLGVDAFYPGRDRISVGGAHARARRRSRATPAARRCSRRCWRSTATGPALPGWSRRSTATA